MANQTVYESRYGISRRRDHRVVWALGAALVLLFAGWAVWAFGSDRSFGLEWVAFESTTGGTVADVTWNVTAPVGTEVTCAIRTVAPSMSTNGWRVVDLPASVASTTTYRESVRAVGETRGIEVYSCWRTSS
jgi:hypothetical protein